MLQTDHELKDEQFGRALSGGSSLGFVFAMDLSLCTCAFFDGYPDLVRGIKAISVQSYGTETGATYAFVGYDGNDKEYVVYY